MGIFSLAREVKYGDLAKVSLFIVKLLKFNIQTWNLKFIKAKIIYLKGENIFFKCCSLSVIIMIAILIVQTTNSNLIIKHQYDNLCFTNQGFCIVAREIFALKKSTLNISLLLSKIQIF
jgi:hypothetical protein